MKTFPGLLARINEDTGGDVFWNEEVMELVIRDDAKAFGARYHLPGGEWRSDVDEPIHTRAVARRCLWLGRTPNALELAALVGSWGVFQEVLQETPNLIDIREHHEDAMQEVVVVGGNPEIIQMIRNEKIELNYEQENALMMGIAFHRQDLTKDITTKLPVERRLSAALWSHDIATLLELLTQPLTLKAQMVLPWAALHGCWPVFEIAKAIGGFQKCDAQFVGLAARGGDPVIFETALAAWPGELQREHCPPGSLNKKCLKVLRARYDGFQASPDDIQMAVKLDNIAFIEDAIAHGEVLPRMIVESLPEAIQSKALDVVHFVLKHQPVPPKNAIELAFEVRASDICLLLLDQPGVERSGLLAMAIRSKLPQVIDKLLKEGADVNAPDTSGETPLTLAIEQLDLPLTQRLLGTDGIDVNRRADSLLKGPIEPAVIAADTLLLAGSAPEADWRIIDVIINSPNFRLAKQPLRSGLADRLVAASKEEIVRLWRSK